jgi:hypothetical protein
VRKELRQRYARKPGMQSRDVAPDRIVQPQPPLFPQLHDRSGGEALGVGRDPEAVARRQSLARGKFGMAEGLFQNHVGVEGDGHYAAGLGVVAHLEFEPARDVIDGGVQPLRHAAHVRPPRR